MIDEISKREKFPVPVKAYDTSSAIPPDQHPKVPSSVLSPVPTNRI